MAAKRIFLSPPHLDGSEAVFIQQALESNYIAPMGPMVDAFEREFAAKVGFAHTLAVSSGTAATHLALREVGVKPGDEVLVSSLTFVGGAMPVVYLGARPVFIDSDEVSWNMDPALLAEELAACAKRGRLPKAVLPTDAYGQSCDQDALKAVCVRHGVPMVEDAAEAVGATYKGRPAGNGADVAIYSFNGNKVLTTAGGGMLASNDRRLIEHAGFLATQARDPAPHYEHSEVGYNYRMSNILAAIGRGQLQSLDARIARRRWVFDQYRQRLEGVAGLTFMPEASYGCSSRWLTAIQLDPQVFHASPEQVRLALEAENVEARPVWKPMHLQPVFKGCRVVGGEVSARLFRQGLCLPSGTAMTEDDIDRITETIRRCGRSG
jgi:dTDP-4-amino-4,6-dideoxygalactose transaminase